MCVCVHDIKMIDRLNNDRREHVAFILNNGYYISCSQSRINNDDDACLCERVRAGESVCMTV